MEQQAVERRRAAGFSLAELLLAVLLLTLVILALAGLTTSALRSAEKASRLEQATEVAESLLTRAVYDAQWDAPPGTRSSFWAASAGSPWIAPTPVTVGGVDYEYRVFADTVSDAAGVPVGTLAGEAGNRLKKVDLVLSWWGSGGRRQGYGRLEVEASRLVNEVDL